MRRSTSRWSWLETACWLVPTASASSVTVSSPRFPHRKRACSGAAVSQFSCCSWVSRASRRLQARPHVVPTLGRLDELKASGQLDRWAGAFTRLDPPAAGVHREVGPLLVVAHYLR